MPALDRTSLVKGAGAVTIGSTQIFSKGDINARWDPETEAVAVSGFGNIDDIIVDGKGVITMQPCGRLTAAMLTALYGPFQNPEIDSSLFGSTDTEMFVNSFAGQKLTFHNSAVIRPPSLKLSAINTAFDGDMEIRALIKNDTERSAANSCFTLAAAAFAGSVDRGDIKHLPYTATWGTTAISVRAGWQVDVDVDVEEFKADDYGTIDVWLKGVTVRARCQPLNLSEALMADQLTQGTTASIGSTARQGKDLTLTAAGGLTIVLKDAQLREGPVQWGESKLRLGEVGFVATRSFAAGVYGSVFTIAMTA